MRKGDLCGQTVGDKQNERLVALTWLSGGPVSPAAGNNKQYRPLELHIHSMQVMGRTARMQLSS